MPKKHKRSYRHLNQADRDRLQALRDEGVRQKEIAKILKVDPATISREIKRNRRKYRKKRNIKNKNAHYEAGVAEHKAYERRKYAKYQGKNINENRDLRKYIIKKLKKYWNPDEIAGRMKKDNEPFYASKTAIYEWLRTVYGQRWCPYLYSRRYHKKKRGPKKPKRHMIPHRIGIEYRPLGAANRSRYGHYEGDAMVSAKKTASKTAYFCQVFDGGQFLYNKVMAKIFVTRKIPDAGITKLKSAVYEVEVNPEDRVLTKDELIKHIKRIKPDAVLALLTDKLDADVFEVASAQKPTVKIFANMAVGFDNMDVEAAKKAGIMVSNTPGVLTDTVAEHTFALMLAIAHRVSEADRFSRAGKYHGWEPMMLLGTDVSKKTLGILGLGRIGSRVAHHAAKGFDMKVLYYDVKRNEEFEKEFSAQFCQMVVDVLQKSDFVSIHVPLLPTTKHLLNAETFKMMKPTAYLINTSRGPVIDEKALAEALKNGVIKGAAIDVFENEPAIDNDLIGLENIILTPHIASATEETRAKMAELAAENIIAALSGKEPPNLVK